MVLVISIYLGANAIYTHFVYQFHKYLTGDLKIVDN